MHITQFLIVCPLVMLAGFIDAIVGGGGLISVPAYMLAGLPVHASIATNKLSSFCGTCISTGRYAKAGYIHLKESIPVILCALAGSAIGARIALVIPDRTFKIIMLVILPLIALYILRDRSLFEADEPYSQKLTILTAMAVAFGIGAYDGFYGPGAGTFMLLLLLKVAHMPLNDANGMAKVINLCTNLSALAVYLFSGNVYVTLGLAAAVFSIAGNYIGVSLFKKGGSKIVKPIMVAVLVLFFIKVFTEII